MVKKGMRKWQPRNSQAGISYLEILVALTLLTVGVLGAVGAVSTAALDIYGGGRETVASAEAQALLERIRNAASYEDMLSYADTPPAGATTPPPWYVEQSKATWLQAMQASVLGPGQGQIAITQVGTVPNRLATITVTVDWPNRTGPPLTLVTRVSEWP